MSRAQRVALLKSLIVASIHSGLPDETVVPIWVNAVKAIEEVR
jgi:hypothetical protein